MKDAVVTAVLIILLADTLFTVGNNSGIKAVLGEETPHDADAMWVEPPTATFINARIGLRFNITIWLNMTDDVYAYQIALLYNRTRLKCMRVGFTAGTKSQFMIGHLSGGTWVIDTSFLGNGSILAFESCSGNDYVPGPHCDSLMWFEFELAGQPIIADFTSRFDITTYTAKNPPRNWVENVTGQKVPIAAYDGYYEFSPPPSVHDVAVTDVRLVENIAVQGETVDVQVDVFNFLNVSQCSNVTLYADAYTGTVGDEIVAGNQSTVVPAFDFVTLSFSWDTGGVTPGNLTVSAKAEASGDVNATNNLLSDGVIQIVPIVHDVAVTGIRPAQEVVYAGDSLDVDVDTRNQGNVVETVNITLYADNDTAIIGDEVVIGSQLVMVEKFSLATATFSWNTTDLAAGNYTLTGAALPLPEEANPEDNNMTDGAVCVFQSGPCPDVDVTCPAAIVINPSVFTYSSVFRARLVNIGNVSVLSTGFEGGLRAVGSRNGTVRLCVNQPNVNAYTFFLPKYGEVQVPLWLMFQPETHWKTYAGTYTLNLTICGTHRRQLTITGIDITVCENGAYIVNNDTATFTWNLTGGSLVYLEAETALPPGWTYSVDPPIGTLFETPHVVSVNITAPPDANEGDVGRVTLSAYKNSTGAMIWQFVYFATTDNEPPTVESVETPTLTPDGHLLFNATVSDKSGIAEVYLHYSADGGEWKNATMHWASGDTFNATRYTLDEAFATQPYTLQYFVSAVDWLGNETSTTTQTITVADDIAVTGVNLTSIDESVGYHVNVDVTIANHGTLPLSRVNVVMYANSTAVTTKPALFLENGASTTIPFALNLSEGSYILTAVAVPSAYETNTGNNAKHLSKMLHLLHDVAAVDLEPSKTVVFQDFPASVQVNATVANHGSLSESFNVALEANGTILENQTVTLVGDGTVTVTFDWNTTGVERGHYGLRACAWPVQGETNTENNNFTGGYVTVSLTGDLTGFDIWAFTPDGVVDGSDVGVVNRCFGSWPDAPPPLRWHNNCDINCDGVIDGADVIIINRHFGEYVP